MPPDQDDPAAACPVDHKTRQVWLQQAKDQAKSQSQTTATPSSAPTPLQAAGCDSASLSQASSPSPSSPHTPSVLDARRVVSTIPRALPSSPSPSTQPANHETETGKDAATGNWIYPSEEMFFNAMKRKNYDPQAVDMRTIVPIHNAVNERAWMEIRQWEKGRGADSCGGPRLASFSGSATSLTPRARWNTFLGYAAPFDRHDWVVDRCGTKVEYVIDFYAGKDEKKEGKSLNFYLDVRPKLNSFEGVKTRIMRFWGF